MDRLVRDLAFVEDQIIREELPKDGTLEYIDVLVTGDIAGAGGGTPLLAALLLDRVRLLMNGNPVFDMTGRQAYYFDATLQGEAIEEQITDPNGGTVPLLFLIRLWITDPRARNPRRGLVDARMLDNLSVELDFGAVTEIFTGGVQTLANLRARIYYGEVRRASGGDLIMVNRAFQYVLDGTRQVNEWKERGAVMRSMLMELFDDTGAATSDGLDVLAVRIDGKEYAVDEVPYQYLRARTTFDSGLSPDEIPDGIAFKDFDPDNAGRPLQSLDGVNVELILEGDVDYVFNVIRRQYLPAETYLRIRRR